jgi:hypothetical protein
MACCVPIIKDRTYVDYNVSFTLDSIPATGGTSFGIINGGYILIPYAAATPYVNPGLLLKSATSFQYATVQFVIVNYSLTDPLILPSSMVLDFYLQTATSLDTYIPPALNSQPNIHYVIQPGTYPQSDPVYSFAQYTDVTVIAFPIQNLPILNMPPIAPNTNISIATIVRVPSDFGYDNSATYQINLTLYFSI